MPVKRCLFDGFRQSDFMSDVRGSTWRKRLAEPLKDQMETIWGLPVNMQATQYRNDLYVDIGPSRRHFQAGFWIGVDEYSLWVRFRVERGYPADSRRESAMQSDWDWHRFWFKLTSLSPRFVDAYNAAISEGSVEIVANHDNQLLLPGSTLEVVTDALRRIPNDQWIDFYITTRVPSDQVVGWGPSAPSRIVDLLHGRKRLAIEAMNDD